METQTHISWLKLALDAYVQEVSVSDLTPSTKATYMAQAAKFVRWVEGRE